MKRLQIPRAVAFLALAVTAPMWTPAVAQDPPPDRWQDTAEFSFVVTGGNSETQTLGFKNKLWRDWTNSSFRLDAGAVRAESTITTRTAFGTSTSSFDLDEESDTELTAEAYFLTGRYDRKISDRFFWFGQAGWDRNRFAGIDNRYTAVGGVGNIWADGETLKFRTDYSLTYTKQEDVVDNPDFDDTFLGFRFSWAFLKKLGQNTTFTNDFIADDNLEDTSDFRLNMTNSIAVAMNSRLALKASLQVLYDHEPSLVEVDLIDNVTDPANPVKIGTVLAELDEIDTIFTTSLVVNF